MTYDRNVFFFFLARFFGFFLFHRFLAHVGIESCGRFHVSFRDLGTLQTKNNDKGSTEENLYYLANRRQQFRFLKKSTQVFFSIPQKTSNLVQPQG